MASHSLADRLLQALVQIHYTPARIIAAPPTAVATSNSSARPRQKRASVAIIIRVRPSRFPTESLHSDEAHPVASTSRSSTSPTLQSFQDSSLLRSRAQSSASLSEAWADQPPSATVTRLQAFFAQPWVQSGTPEILYIKRASRASDRWSAQVAFPGGRQEPDDESPLYTAMRETWEEVGVDLAEKKDFVEIGQLDDREITTSLGKRLLMVLSPFIFLHTSPEAPIPDIQASEVASAHWIPLTCLLAPHVRWGDVRIDITSRITPRSRIIRRLLAILTGNMHFKSILLPNDPILSPESSPSQLDPVATGAERPPLSLWGLTLGMSLDLLSNMSLPETSGIAKTIEADKIYGNTVHDFSVPPTPHGSFPMLLAPSMSSIFPTFSYPDINFFIWLFGFRYRHLVKRWNERFQRQQIARPDLYRRRSMSGSGGSAHAGQVNFAGMALNRFYAAVRKALILAVVLRASILLGGIGAASWWMVARLRRRRKLWLSA